MEIQAEHTVATSLRLEAVAQEYLDYAHHGRGMSRATTESYGSDFRIFVRYLQARGRPTQVTSILRADIRSFITESTCAAATKRRRFDALSSLFRYTSEQGYIDHTPVHRDDRPRAARQVRRPIPAEDVAHIFLAAESHVERAILGVLIYAGLRASEVVALRKDDVGLAADAGPHLLVRGKGNRQRRVPIAPQLEPLLQAHLARAGQDGNPPAFAPQGAPLTYKRLRSLFRRCLRRAGLADRGYTLHQLRHTFATQLVQRADIKTAQEILGHADINTTAGYCHSSDDARRAALSCLPEYGAAPSAPAANGAGPSPEVLAID